MIIIICIIIKALMRLMKIKTEKLEFLYAKYTYFFSLDIEMKSNNHLKTANMPQKSFCPFLAQLQGSHV